MIYTHPSSFSWADYYLGVGYFLEMHPNLKTKRIGTFICFYLFPFSGAEGDDTSDAKVSSNPLQFCVMWVISIGMVSGHRVLTQRS